MTATFRSERIPLALQQQPNWVLWRSEMANGRPTKIPYWYHDGLHKASTTDPMTWTMFPLAVHYAEEYDIGLGFVFTDSPFTGIDLDGCRNAETGEIDDWALDLIRLVNSYSEISPSGTGVKIFVRGKLPGPAVRFSSEELGYGGKHRGVEAYDVGRYFTVTGNVLLLADLSTTIEQRDLTEFYKKVKELAQHSPRPEPRTNDGSIPAGKRHDALVSFAGQLTAIGIGYDAFELALLALNRERFSPPLEEREVRRQARDLHKRYNQSPRLVLTGSKTKVAEPVVGECILVPFSQITPEPPTYLWEPYIPDGMLTMLTGDPGVGKSFIALAIAADVTKRGGTVFYLTLENHPRKVLRPRFDSLRGDPTKIYWIKAIQFGDPKDGQVRTVTLQDIVSINRRVREHHPQLIVIDPIQSFLGANIDAHRMNETRPVMDGLTELAEREATCPLLLRHGTKAQTSRIIHRGLGSIDFTAAVRSELYAGETADKKQKAMLHTKNNMGPLGKGLGYTIESIDPEGQVHQTGYFRWTGESELKSGDLTRPEATEEESNALEEAKSFLVEYLSDGPKERDLVIKRSRRRSISYATLRRAKKELELGWELRDGMYFWTLPSSYT